MSFLGFGVIINVFDFPPPPITHLPISLTPSGAFTEAWRDDVNVDVIVQYRTPRFLVGASPLREPYASEGEIGG